MPYAWQEKGETIRLPSHGGKRINVLGFMTARAAAANDLVAYTVEGSIDGETFIACMNAFVASREMPTVVVIDNAPVHRSGKVRDTTLARSGCSSVFPTPLQCSS